MPILADGREELIRSVIRQPLRSHTTPLKDHVRSLRDGRVYVAVAGGLEVSGYIRKRKMEHTFGLLHRREYERWKMERAFGLLHRRVYYKKKKEIQVSGACINEVRDYTGTADTPYCTRG